MSTQRPFFANFFGAFRARTSPAFQAKSSTSTSPSSIAATAHVSTTTTHTTSSVPKSISTQAQSDSSASQSQVYQQSAGLASPTAKPNANPFASASLTSTSPGTHFYGPHLPRSSGSSSPVPFNTGISMSPPGQSTPMTRGRQRRGSDSSNASGGFMDALGSDKWYIGGRTAGGDEKFYRLGMVTGAPGKRVQSLDRLNRADGFRRAY